MNRKTHEPVTEDMEIEGFDIHGVHPDQGAPIIQFGTAQRQDLNDDFAQLDRDINQLHNQEAKHGEMSERQQRLLEIMKSRNPEWDKYFNPDGTPKVMNFEQENDGKTSIERLKEKYEATKLGKSAKKSKKFLMHNSNRISTNFISSYDHHNFDHNYGNYYDYCKYYNVLESCGHLHKARLGSLRFVPRRDPGPGKSSAR